METWISVFLAIIALQTLVQAVFVVGLAFGARRGGQALAAVEERVERELPRHLVTVANACERAAAVAETAQEQVEKAGAALSEADARLRGVLNLASGMVSRVADHAPADLEDDEQDEEEDAGNGATFALPGRLGQAFALLKGAQRAWAVWSEPANGQAREAPPS
jgi:hypothetical protein